ncbi:MAG TPA: hypothetical protein VN258_20485 [Mobilitalea sp.]|nr:hypothetical protein [Mobilitalea sp.]
MRILSGIRKAPEIFPAEMHILSETVSTGGSAEVIDNAACYYSNMRAGPISFR